jgi:hypothetical protein
MKMLAVNEERQPSPADIKRGQEIADRVEARLRELGKSVDDYSEELGHHRRQLGSQLRRLRAGIGLGGYTWTEIAQHLGLSVDYLLHGIVVDAPPMRQWPGWAEAATIAIETLGCEPEEVEAAGRLIWPHRPRQVTPRDVSDLVDLHQRLSRRR